MPFDDRPFQDRKTYEELHRCLAVNEAGEVVRVVDWARNDPQTDRRVLVVALVDPDRMHTTGLAWEVREDALVPVPMIKGAQETAAAWRAEQAARKIEAATTNPHGVAGVRRI